MKILYGAALAAALALGGLATAQHASAGTFRTPPPVYSGPIVTCEDGASIATRTTAGACDENGGIYTYQNVAFVCVDGTLIQDPATPNPCAADQGVQAQIDSPVAVPVPQPASNVSAAPIPVFPTNR